MLLRTTILALVLLTAETHGAAGKKPNVENPKNTGRSLFDSQAVTMQEASQGNLPGRSDYVRMEADGTASVYMRIDMSLILERLNMIPNIGSTVNVLVQKIDQLISVVMGQSHQPVSVDQLIVRLEQVIIGRIDQQDSKLNGIIQLLERIGSQVVSITEMNTQTLKIVQQILSGGGGGGNCGEQFRIIERIVQQVVNKLVIIQQQIDQTSQKPDNMLPTILQQIQQNIQIVQQNYQILQQIESGIQGGLGSCSSIVNGQAQISQTLQTVISLIERTTTQIVSIIQKNPGGTGQEVGYIMELIKFVKTILIEIEKLRSLLLQRTQLLETRITEQREQIIMIKQITKEQTSYAKTAASAAIAASRALKCPDGSSPLGDASVRTHQEASGGGRTL